MGERERGRKSKWERRWGVGGGWLCGAVGASFQVSNTTSGDGFKTNSPPPINTQAEREYISCLTIIHFENEEEEEKSRKKGGGEGIHPALLLFL